MSPRPTTASEAATTITVSAKICPLPLPALREKAIRARFPAFSMISSARRMIRGLRRTRTPKAPVAKSATESTR
jgi:hypothetical protein